MSEPETKSPKGAEEPLQNENVSQEASAKESDPNSDEFIPERLYLIPYPKVVFLYPTLFVTLIAAVTLSFVSSGTEGSSGTESNLSAFMAALVLGIFAVNLVVLTLDFPRATSLTLFFIGATVGLGIILVSIRKPELLPFMQQIVAQIRPVANATFYWLLFSILTGIFMLVKVKVQFDYWEVRRNEILHHHGILSDLRRYPTAGLQVEKEINDVFEYCLMRSGKLTLRPQGEHRAFVLENLPNISSKEMKLTRMLSAIKVKVQA